MLELFQIYLTSYQEYQTKTMLSKLFNSSKLIYLSAIFIILSIAIRVMVFDAENVSFTEMFSLLDESFLDVLTLVMLWIASGVFVFMMLKWIYLKIFK